MNCIAGLIKSYGVVDDGRWMLDDERDVLSIIVHSRPKVALPLWQGRGSLARKRILTGWRAEETTRAKD